MRTAEMGDQVEVRVALRRGNGEDAFDERSFEAKLGTGRLPAFIERAICGLAVGQTRQHQLSPSEGYGERLEELVFRTERSQIPPEATPGTILQVEANGKPGLVRLVGFEDDQAILDANHPLAGETLDLKIELLAIE